MRPNWHSTSSGASLKGAAIVGVCLVGLLIAAFLAFANFDFSAALKGRLDASQMVEDSAALLSDEERRHLGLVHELLRDDYAIDYRVVTAPSIADINRFAVERFEALLPGEAGGGGMLLVIDPVTNLVRLEIGYALEGQFPDAFIAYIEQRQMVPFFQANRIADGILAASELVVTRAKRAKAGSGTLGEIWLEGSGGGGATSRARIDEGQDPVTWQGSNVFQPGAMPGVTLAAYFKAMAARNGDPGLPLYSVETKKMLQNWVMTPAQMDGLVAAYRNCQAEPAIFDAMQRLAVLRYPPLERACAPFFFVREGGGWLLDLTMMQRAIRFGRTNAWHFERSINHPYKFAFADWRFDAKGFPQP